jgi:hypothetical protein
MTRRDKRVVAIAGVLIVASIGGAGAWAALRPGSYDQSRDGCITVNLPSSMGGSLLHECGGQARRTCQQAFAADTAAARLTRPQCRLAGLPAGRSPAATASSAG